ncbi:MAG: FAD-dependent oxidoreductase [Actinomycetota bacterium]
MPSSDEQFDVLVVGGGPGGSAAAYHLARHGVHVALVEKSSYPREKVCGDGLTPRAVKALLEMGVDTEAPGFVRVEGLRTYGPRGVLDLPWPALNDWPAYGLVRTRLDFDELLAHRAKEAGATLYENTEATTPIIDRGWVVGSNVRELLVADGNGARVGAGAAAGALSRSRSGAERRAGGGDGAKRPRQSTGPEVARDTTTATIERRPPKPGIGPTRAIRAKFVLAADGASSRFAGQAGVKRDLTRPLGIAARRYYRWDRAQVPWLEAWLDLWEGEKLLPGYGWIFPIDDEVVNVGAGLLNTFHGFKDLSAQRVFDVFIRMLPPEWGLNEDTAIGPVRSGPLPMGFNRRPLAQPGVLLIGDAGGLVNPFNGEGISYAMETGQAAAELVYEALAKGKPGLAQAYPTLLRQRYGKYFAMGNVFVKAIGNPRIMSFATRHGLHREWLMQFALRMMANLTDGFKGDVHDRILAALEAVSPTA